MSLGLALGDLINKR